jgi:hypothetical protein
MTSGTGLRAASFAKWAITPALPGRCERRYDAQRGGDVGPVAQGVDGAQARRPDDQVRRPLPADPSDDADDRVAFVVGQAAWFARRAEGDQT